MRDEGNAHRVSGRSSRASGLPKSTSIEGVLPDPCSSAMRRNQCGTLFSQLDFVSEGCNAVFLAQAQSDRTLLATGNYVKRAATPGSFQRGSGRAGAEAPGRGLGHRVRPVCRAVPLARKFLQRDQGAVGPARRTCPAIRADSIRSTSRSIRKTSSIFGADLRHQVHAAAQCSAN